MGASDKSRKMKILHGMSEVSGQGGYSVRGLRMMGADATMAVWRRNLFGYPVDVDLHIKKERLREPIYAIKALSKMLFFAFRAVFTYDVFHFHFCNSLLPFGMDLFWLRLLGKRVIMEYHGSDIRYAYNREMPAYYPYKHLVTWSKRGLLTNNIILKFADTIITHDEELRKHIPHKNLFITPLRINVERFSPTYPETRKDRIVIVHAPSNFILKGSQYIIESVNALKKRYPIDFFLVENMTQEQAFEFYQMADIIIDQMFAQTYGVFAVEAMAMGKPVVGWISDEIRKTFPDSMPIVSATIDSLADVLETLILDGDLRRKLGIAGRKYVEDYHDYRKVAMVQMDIYQNVISPMSTRNSFEYTKNKKVPINNSV